MLTHQLEWNHTFLWWRVDALYQQLIGHCCQPKYGEICWLWDVSGLPHWVGWWQGVWMDLQNSCKILNWGTFNLAFCAPQLKIATITVHCKDPIASWLDTTVSPPFRMVRLMQRSCKGVWPPPVLEGPTSPSAKTPAASWSPCWIGTARARWASPSLRNSGLLWISGRSVFAHGNYTVWVHMPLGKWQEVRWHFPWVTSHLSANT